MKVNNHVQQWRAKKKRFCKENLGFLQVESCQDTLGVWGSGFKVLFESSYFTRTVLLEGADEGKQGAGRSMSILTTEINLMILHPVATLMLKVILTDSESQERGH